jgi:hypothetical protein
MLVRGRCSSLGCRVVGWLLPDVLCGVDPDVRSVRVMIYWVVGSEGGDVGGYPDIILAHDRCSVV